MFEISFRSKLILTFGLLLMLAVMMSGLAVWGIGQSEHLLARSRLAHQVLDSHLRVAESGQRLLRLVAVPTAPNTGAAAKEAAVRRALEQHCRRIRWLIAAEADLVGDAEDETDELARLDDIEARLTETLDAHEAVRSMIVAGRSGAALTALGKLNSGGIASEWRRLIAEAIDEETREVAAVDRAAARIARVLQVLLSIGTIAAAVLTLGALIILRRDLDRPLARLTAGTEALARGNLSHRIGLTGKGELQRLARNFDRMAIEIESQQAALSAARSGLAVEVAERTAELRTANARLSAVDNNRRRLLADISHELRTPLTVVQGEAEVTLRGGEKPVDHYVSALDRILEQARHMSRLVDDLLFSARQDAGEVRLHNRQIDVCDIVGRACSDMDVLARERGGRVDCTLPGKPMTMLGDPDRIRQLLFILVDNALRYSAGAPMVAVKVAAAAHGAVITVTDAGLGIAAADLPFVFERFQRGANARQHDPNGSGLGLFMAHAIVAAHGGSIGIDSRERVGTTVTLTLPATAALRMAS